MLESLDNHVSCKQMAPSSQQLVLKCYNLILIWSVFALRHWQFRLNTTKILSMFFILFFLKKYGQCLIMSSFPYETCSLWFGDDYVPIPWQPACFMKDMLSFPSPVPLLLRATVPFSFVTSLHWWTDHIFASKTEQPCAQISYVLAVSFTKSLKHLLVAFTNVWRHAWNVFCSVSIYLPNISACLARAALTTVSMSDLFQCRILHFQVEKIIALAVFPKLAYYSVEYGNCLRIAVAGVRIKVHKKMSPRCFKHAFVTKTILSITAGKWKRVFCPFVKKMQIYLLFNFVSNR